MTFFTRVRSWLRASAQRQDFEQRMQEEMRAHVDLLEADLQQRGLPPDEARRRARAHFGSLEARKDECRQAFGLQLLDEFRGDVLCISSAAAVSAQQNFSTTRQRVADHLPRSLDRWY